jgi:hypothetical protein
MLLGTPRGAFIAILKVNVHSPLRVFQGILSEYLALKCSPIVVYMDFRDFLVMRNILYTLGGCPLPTLWGFWGNLILI